MPPNTINMYPYWGPANAGPASDFALPSEPIGQPQLLGIEADSLRLRVPQETVENNLYSDVWQWNEIIIGSPQGPVTVPEQFLRADSLMSYAMMTLGGEVVLQGQAVNSGAKNVQNG